eukprot:CAMPEP_0194149126 /NCGR_PEP_ID=MMETSP0152-20130528/36396_1 /TAXON_ID=1049557 /ORGANISM="Thalassiothrix antarctica, Strain L6-D1" /LENGTH=149 /DNA_ID=CAMNT_0038851103 /DNA_START=402 /DNA_END=851 /DNA_ORIENTATION=-
MTNFSNNLRYLYLDNNQFTGSIPGNGIIPPLLERWDISNNQLTGTLPSTLFSSSSFENIKSIQFNSNLNLFGTLPTEIGLATSLQLLEGDNNEFTGTIPSEIGQLKELKMLKFDNNRLRGIFPNQYLCNIPFMMIDCENEDEDDNSFKS